MTQLFALQYQHQAVPLNMVRKGPQSDFYIGLPRFLLMGEMKKVIRGCRECGVRRGTTAEAIVGFDVSDGTGPRHLIKLTVWRCQESALKDDLLTVLRDLLHVPVIPVVRMN